MENLPVAVLCTFGFLKEFRPSDPFVTPYLSGPVKNFTLEEIYQQIYPVGTYSTLILVVVVFLVTDALCYKPVIVVQGLAGITTFCLLIWSYNMPLMQVCQFFYGLFIASEVAYTTYIYSYYEKDAYRKVTSYTRISLQCGRFLSGIFGQLLVSFYLLDYHDLNYLTLTSLILATLAASLLPGSEKSLYFHNVLPKEDCGLTTNEHPEEQQLCSNQDSNEPVICSDKCTNDNISSVVPQTAHAVDTYDNNHKSGLALIWYDFCSSYSDVYVVRWSLWWAFTHCGYLQVSSYVQNLWQDTSEINGDQLYNGAASAVYAVTGILATWAVGQVRVAFDKYSNWLLASCASIAGVLVVWSTFSHSLLIQYLLYGMFKVLYQVMMTLANSEVAKSLKRDSLALVFGFNTFAALVLQTIVTATVVGKGGLELPIRTQFMVYGVYFCAIGVAFGVMALFNFIQDCCQTPHTLQENQNIA